MSEMILPCVEAGSFMSIVAIVWPSRRIVVRSAILAISPSLWEMMTMVTP